LGRAEKPSDPTYGFPPPQSPYGVYHFERDAAPTTDIALKFISEKSKGAAPWILFVSWIWPHAPYKAPESTRKDFGEVKIPPNVPPGPPRAFAAKALPDYYGMIEAVDQQFARLMDALKQAGVADDTIVIFSSDHGDMIGSQGYKAKRWPYEESARVPFLIRYPREIPAGRTISDPFGTPDIYPTMAGLAGVTVPQGLDGADFSALFTDETKIAPRDYVYMEMAYAYVPWPGWRAFRTRDFMYARTESRPWLLYDLTKDRWETNNLVGAANVATAKVHQMDDRLTGMMKKYGDSWTMKATSGDLASWLPGGPKQQTQNLGVSYPGEARSSELQQPAKRKRKKAAASSGAGDDD
jgi:arylsulfatase A-like enzyme